MRIVTGLLLSSLVALAGCATTYAIRPASGQEVGGQSVAGVSLVADPAAWEAEPYDLPNYLTPIAVRITNNSRHDVRVSYADFALVNEHGFRYSAVNPYTTMQAPIGQLPLAPEADPVVILAGLEGAPLMSAAYVRGGGRAVASPGRRFFVHPRARYVFRYYDPWPYGFADPPYYGPYVTAWNQSNYRGTPTADVLRLGLPEGVVRPGGRVSGFVYFHGAGQRSNRLQLTWTARAPEGQVVATILVPFVVVPE